MNKIIQGVATIGLIFVAVFCSFIVFLYIGLLLDKIAHPTFKNLPYSDYAWIGLIVLALAILDFFVLRHLLRKLKQHVGGTWR